MRIILFLLCLFSVQVYLAQADTITLVSYNLLNFPDGRNDCGSGNVNLPNRTDTLRKILQYLCPDIFVACEIQTQEGADSVLTRSLNVFGATNYLMAPFVYSNGGGGSLNNAMYYNSDKLIFLRQTPIQTAARDINHYTLMVKDPNIALHRDTLFLEVYMSHLKAGNGTSNAALRAAQTQILRTYVENKPLKRNHFFCGDLNVYSSNEQGYQNLISGGNNPFFDPIFAPGSWNNNGSFAGIHTQSTRSSGAWACGSTGGMDDRFDQILVTQNVLSGADNVSYLTNSYDAVGNDGQRYNSGLLSSPPITAYPDSVVNALFYLSDHLPVLLKVKPTLPTSNGLGLTYTHNGPLCTGDTNGQATVVSLYGQTPFTYQWDANAGSQTSATATNLSPGPYCVTVTDAMGMTDDVCFEILEVPAISASIFPTSSTYLCDGQAAVIANGGTPPYVYSWNDPQNQTTQTATGLCAGTYVCMISDQGGCSLEVTTTIVLVGLIEEWLSSGALKVSPNPFSHQIEVQNSGEKVLEVEEIILRDSRGRVVQYIHSKGIQVNASKYLYTNKLSPGIYLLELYSKGNRHYIKLMK